MTVPARNDAAGVERAAARPGSHLVGHHRPAHAVESTRWAWTAVILVLLGAIGLTVGLLVVQWMATSSGTVAR
jgi:hypothetical protein